MKWYKNGFVKMTKEELKDIVLKASETKHGKWIKRTLLSEEECSNCNKPPKMLFGILPDYCPWCGAEMDLGRSKG